MHEAYEHYTRVEIDMMPVLVPTMTHTPFEELKREVSLKVLQKLQCVGVQVPK